MRVYIAGPGGTVTSRLGWYGRPPAEDLDKVGTPRPTHRPCPNCGEERRRETFLVGGGACQVCRNKTRREEERRWKAARAAAVAAVLGPEVASTTLPRGPFVLLYRCWSEDGALLYVGITAHGMRRVRAHADRGWFEREVAAMTFQRVPAEHAATAEQEAIRAERPRYNIVHQEGGDAIRGGP